MAGSDFDPRHMITADAFSVSEEVLGLPLATGGRRLVAFAVDGILVGFLAMLGWQVLGVFLGFFFFRVATKKTSQANPQLGIASRTAAGIGRGFRYSVGCLGGFILIATFIVGTGTLGNLISGISESDRADIAGVMGNVLVAGRGGQALSTAQTEEEAEVAAVDLGAAGMRLSPELTLDAMMETIEETTPELDMDRADFMARVEAQIAERVPGASANPGVTEADDADDVNLSLDSAWAVYRAGVADELPVDVDDADPAVERLEAARVVIATVVASPELASQQRTIEGLRDDLRDQQAAEAAARQAAEERGGVFAWFVTTLDDLGLTFGWGALYFATLLSWFQGRTPGKRLLGMRVIRLDGEPITLYIAFERAGGYAAGLATGLLGFAQILWDPNRQAIHDKIAGTVVILEGKARIKGAGLPVS